MDHAPLSIVSVVFEDPYFWERNVALTRELNPEAQIRWIVVDNSDPPVVSVPDRPDIRVESGVTRPRSRDLGSLHHALALEKALGLADTRFVALLDHDFYVIRPDWAGQVVDHMVRRGLALFGSVWHPRWFYQYRSFPTVHLMVVDTDRLGRAEIDLRPRIESDRWWHLINDERVRMPRVLRDTLKAQRIRDTGWDLQRRLRGSDTKRYETLVPHYVRPRGGRARWEQRLQRALPSSWLKYPSATEAHTEVSVLATSLPEAHRRGWEEHFWRSELFAVHLRRVGRQMAGQVVADDRDLLERFL